MKRVLITEDNESNRHTIRYLLDQNGYEIVKAITVEQGVLIIAPTSYALPGDRKMALEAGCPDYIERLI
jgi:CheY-like chemotaxis protein